MFSYLCFFIYMLSFTLCIFFYIMYFLLRHAFLSHICDSPNYLNLFPLLFIPYPPS